MRGGARPRPGPSPVRREADMSYAGAMLNERECRALLDVLTP